MTGHAIDATDRFGLGGKRALVVGAGQGIGLATARTVAQCGVTLAIVEQDPVRLSAACAELDAFGLQIDVTSSGAGSRAVAEAAAAIGPLDILVNIVGGGRRLRMTDQTADDQLEMMQVNYFHHADFSTAFARACIADGRPGAMVLLSSVAGLTPFPERGGYGAAKAAVCLLVAQLAVELGRDSIRVNGIAPGVVRTDRSVLSADAEAHFAAAIPLGRIGGQQDVANTVLFLCSDLSTYLTGQTIVLDGGASLLTKMWP